MPFKIQLVQELKPNDLPQRRIFGEWALGKLAEDPLFLSKLCSATKFIFGKIVDRPFEAQSWSTFVWNNLQTLNYMDQTIDSNKDFMNFSEHNVFVFEKFSYSSLYGKSILNFVKLIYDFFVFNVHLSDLTLTLQGTYFFLAVFFKTPHWTVL